MRKIVIVGATSAIAEHCARLWLSSEPCELMLIGRNLNKLERIAADLKVRSPKSNIDFLQADFFNPLAINELISNLFKDKPIDLALIAQGDLIKQNLCQENLETLKQSLDINGLSPVLFAEAFAKRMEKQKTGTLAVISSVAGERSRPSLYVYGAAKAMLSHYMIGLQQRFKASKVKIVLIKPGPVDTPMTAHLKQTNIPLAKVDKVAETIVEGIEKGKKIIYAPKIWLLIMAIVRQLPNFIFYRLTQ